MKEKNYIRYRKSIAFGNSLCFYLCRIFPIQKNLISVCTFEGKGGFGCNPKYVVKELHKRNPEYRFVWFVNDMDKNFPDYIKKVPNTLWSRAYWLSVSKVWIDNYRKPYGTKKRKGQYYLNTWHGSVGFKSIGLWRGSAFSEMAYLVSKNDSQMIDAVVIDSEWCSAIFPKGLLYDGFFLKTGMPRCDVLVNDRAYYRKKIRNKFGLSEEDRIVMYAPTFREMKTDGKRVVSACFGNINFDALCENLCKRFGGKWHVCVRMHPQLQNGKVALGEKNYIDVTAEDDMYELLAAMDCFVTDYSSAAMEAGFMGIPVFLYADDFQTFIRDRGGQQWIFEKDLRYKGVSNPEMIPLIELEFPFSIAETNEELEQDVLNFNIEEYTIKMINFKEKLQMKFDGKASVRVAKHLQEFL